MPAAKKKAMRKRSLFERNSLIVQGIFTILFGIAAVFWPSLTSVTLLYIFAIFLLVDGVIGLVMGLVNIAYWKTALWWLLLGIVQLGVGIFLVRNPEVSFETLIILLGVIFAIRGAVDVFRAFFHDGSAIARTLTGIVGVLGIIVGFILFNQPIAGGVAFVWILGLYALITGPVILALATDINNNK